jgi:hypothetical protein
VLGSKLAAQFAFGGLSAIFHKMAAGRREAFDFARDAEAVELSDRSAI